MSDNQTLLAIEVIPDLRVRVWDLATRQVAFQYDRSDLVNVDCTVCPIRNEIFVVTNQQVLRIDATTGKTLGSWPYDGLDITSVACSHDGATLAIGRKDRTLHILDAQTGQHIRTILGYLSPPDFIRFSGDGKTLITLDDRGVVQFWQVASGSELLTWPSDHPIRRFDLTDDDHEFAIIHGETVELFDASRTADGQ